jgi:hypothetical protein
LSTNSPSGTDKVLKAQLWVVSLQQINSNSSLPAAVNKGMQRRMLHPLNALQMLSGNDQNTANSNTDASIPDFTPVSTAVSPSQSPEYVGVWAARVGNSSEVQLRLEATGAFEWSANSNGKVSSFRGSFSVDNGALKLLREDNQQLVGSFQMSNSNAFSFTVANANGLQFQRR